VGYIDKRIVAAAVGANGSASLGKAGCQGILLRGEVLFIEVDAKALNPLQRLHALDCIPSSLEEICHV